MASKTLLNQTRLTKILINAEQFYIFTVLRMKMLNLELSWAVHSIIWLFLWLCHLSVIKCLFNQRTFSKHATSHRSWPSQIIALGRANGRSRASLALGSCSRDPAWLKFGHCLGCCYHRYERQQASPDIGRSRLNLSFLPLNGCQASLRLFSDRW